MPNTVTVACKLPNGIFLEVSDIVWTEVKGEKIGRPTNTRRHFVRGSASARRMEVGEVDQRGNISPTLMGETQNVVGGFGLTHDIPQDFRDEWVKQNADYEPFKKGLIFANSRPEKVRAAAKELGPSRHSGLEPINPPPLDREGRVLAGAEIDPRMGRGEVVTRNEV